MRLTLLPEADHLEPAIVGLLRHISASAMPENLTRQTALRKRLRVCTSAFAVPRQEVARQVASQSALGVRDAAEQAIWYDIGSEISVEAWQAAGRAVVNGGTISAAAAAVAGVQGTGRPRHDRLDALVELWGLDPKTRRESRMDALCDLVGADAEVHEIAEAFGVSTKRAYALAAVAKGTLA